MLERCIIKYEFKNFFIGKTFFGGWFKIKKNQFNKHFTKGEDYNFYCRKEKSLIINTLIPISEEEAFKQAS